MAVAVAAGSEDGAAVIAGSDGRLGTNKVLALALAVW